MFGQFILFEPQSTTESFENGLPNCFLVFSQSAQLIAVKNWVFCLLRQATRVSVCDSPVKYPVTFENQSVKKYNDATRTMMKAKVSITFVNDFMTE